MENKTAKEMFEELGYVLTDDNSVFVEYTQTTKIDISIIRISKYFKNVYKVDKDLEQAKVIYFEEIDAIQQKIKEIEE